MGFFDLFRSKPTPVEPVKNDISDFFKIDICDIFKYNPVFEGTELNSVGSQIDKYSLRLKELEMNMFFEVEIIKFQSGEYNLNFKGNTNIISDEAKEFIKFAFQQFGYDDNGKGNITSSDYQDVQNDMFDRWWHHNGIWMTNVAERNISLFLSESITIHNCGLKLELNQTKTNLQEQQCIESTEPPARKKNDNPSIYEADEVEIGEDSSLRIRFAEMNESGSIIRETTDIDCLVECAQIVKEHLMWLQRNEISVNSASPVIIMKSVLYMDCNESILRIAKFIIDKYKSQYKVADDSEKENLTVDAFKEIDKCIYFVFGTINKEKTLSELNTLRDMIEDTYSTV